MKAERAALLASPAIGSALRTSLVELYDGWLAGLFAAAGGSGPGPSGSGAGASGSGAAPGLALVAVGGLGRREVSPASDVDLVLVHSGDWSGPPVATVADALWYPIWDSGIGLDHSVRTVGEAVAIAAGDLKAALGLLDARLVAGDPALAAELLSRTRAAWRAGAHKRLPELRAAGLERARTDGELAFLLEPDLKSARGGLRDVHALQAIAAAQVADPPGQAVRDAADVLLDVRGELHRRTAGAGRRTVDRLLLQEQDAIAATLGFADADALMAAVAGAGRAIAYACDTTWRQVRPAAPRRRLLGRRGAEPVRRPLAQDVVEQDGEVVLARDADPAADPVLVLRVAQAAAWAALPISPVALARLADCPPLAAPWPQPALDAFVGLLAAGPPAVEVLEALDHAGLLERLLPEWVSVRSKPQRNSYHRFTVDRHLLETAAEAAALTRRVARPDLLLLGALLHDLGKGIPGDHTETGIVAVRELAPRLGLPAEDVDVLVAMVRHHLLLPDVATRRDLADPATARAVADAVGSGQVLELLHALTEADSAATGPAAWSAWKAGLIDELVRRTAALLAGLPEAEAGRLAPAQAALVAAGVFALEVVDDEVTVVAPDRPGLLALAAGVLALHRLDVRSAAVSSVDGMGVTVWRVSPRFGALPDWVVVRDDLRRALAGELALPELLSAREAAYSGRAGLPPAPPTVTLVDDASDAATVLEVRAPDALGVLHRITTALVDCGLDVRSAHISTLGADVVDAFYVAGPDGGKLADPALRESVRTALLTALAS